MPAGSGSGSCGQLERFKLPGVLRLVVRQDLYGLVELGVGEVDVSAEDAGPLSHGPPTH